MLRTTSGKNGQQIQMSIDCITLCSSKANLWQNSEIKKYLPRQ